MGSHLISVPDFLLLIDPHNSQLETMSSHAQPYSYFHIDARIQKTHLAAFNYYLQQRQMEALMFNSCVQCKSRNSSSLLGEHYCWPSSWCMETVEIYICSRWRWRDDLVKVPEKLSGTSSDDEHDLPLRLWQHCSSVLHSKGFVAWPRRSPTY
jgi:hypothetical protein